jgi:hypothetical protein
VRGWQLQGTWARLYTSEENGLSFNRICHHILGYRGPTVLLARDSQVGARLPVHPTGGR